MSLNRYTHPPRTPPRYRESQESNTGKLDATSIASPESGIFSLHTPVSSTKSSKHYNIYKKQKSKDGKLLTPEITPHKSPNAFRRGSLFSKDSIIQLTSPNRSLAVRQLILPLRQLTVGKGRSLLPSIKISSILEDLPSLDDEDIVEVSQEIDLTAEEHQTPALPFMVPSTPRKNIITSRQVQEWYDKPRNDQLSDDEDEVFEGDDIFRSSQSPRLVNPFVEKGIEVDNPFVEEGRAIDFLDVESTPETTKPNIFNPFVSQNPSGIDYATQLELVNHRTGKRVVRDLPLSAQNIKPKKLNFSNAAGTPSSRLAPPSPPFLNTCSPSKYPIPSSRNKDTDRGDLNKKFVLKNLNNFINIKPKNGLDFEIFNDESK